MAGRPQSVFGVPLYPKTLKKRIIALLQRDGLTFAELSDQKGNLGEHVIDVESCAWVQSHGVKR